ncbi:MULTISPECIES: cytochrome P450 [Streptomyces]|uniref:cytochrome P450 n=1 Tax=Streptomyces TaxID=1883 RepID=UPI00132EBB9B|nr:cytochrome P450 [Streptomyces sp. NHF165]QHF93109.1 cytochrome P450 [Streptomyces sp. NHF165]
MPASDTEPGPGDGAAPPPALGYPTERTCPFSPPPAFARLREQPGLPAVEALEGGRPWLVTRYADARAVLGSPAFSARFDTPGFPLMSPSDVQQRDDRTESLIRTDDPEHLRQRRRLTRDFTVKRIAALRPEIQGVVDGALDELLAHDGSADLIATVALPIPSRVICLLLGVPYADHGFFQRAAARALAGDSSPDEVRTALGELGDYLAALVREKVRDPQDDILSRLATAYLVPGEIDEREMVTIAMTLLVAGFETTGNMIGLGTALFLTHPEQRALFTAGDEQLQRNAVEELLRYLSIAHHPRQFAATEDVTVGGHTVRAGEGVLISLPAVNRDADAFDDPDTFDITRPAQQHLAFSYGTHQCLGQALARMELLLYFRTLFARVPSLRLLDAPEDFDLKQRSRAHGFRSLSVAWQEDAR